MFRNVIVAFILSRLGLSCLVPAPATYPYSCRNLPAEVKKQTSIVAFVFSRPIFCTNLHADRITDQTEEISFSASVEPFTSLGELPLVTVLQKEQKVNLNILTYC